MTAGVPVPPDEIPYASEGTAQVTPPEEALKVWHDVQGGLEKNQTVVWTSAVESLRAATQHLRTSQEARVFVEKYMAQVIGILVEQNTTKTAVLERRCVQDSILLAAEVIAIDLSIQIPQNGDSRVLDVLSLLFNKKKAFYRGTKSWNSSTSMNGLPEVRLQAIERFRSQKGFQLLEKYLRDRIGTAMFLSLDDLRFIIIALGDAVSNRPTAPEQAAAFKEMEDDAIGVSKAIMDHFSACDEEALKKFPSENMLALVHDLQRLYDRLMSSRRKSTFEFYEFWRSLILKHITSQSLPLKLIGWQQIDDILDASESHRPPPRSFEVSEAGCDFVNGNYNFVGTVTPDGYAQAGMDVTYRMEIPENNQEHGGKKLTLFRCTMRSQQKWWFLSEADEEQPGTDRDIDYYQHKSKEHEEQEPPPSGWLTCRSAGQDPPPRLKSKGLMVPAGKEFDTLEHQLAKWAIENGIIELVLGDSVHREIVSRSTALIKFLASMCERDSSDTVVEGMAPNMYCLQTSHLLLAWKTCTKKADAAVSAQVYQLLVTILPSCPKNLAIPLVEAIQASLANKDNRDLNEVAEFCAALASANMTDRSSLTMSDDVRAEILELLWGILMHPEASSLKTYDHLKRFVTSELRVEPEGSRHREKYLQHCIESLSSNSKLSPPDAVDEAQALKVTKLTSFVLAACPVEQASVLIVNNSGALLGLLFNELTAFLRRRKTSKATNRNGSDSKAGDSSYLSERLRVLRFVYGLTTEIYMKMDELRSLWQLCDDPQSREELMIFIADASSGSSPSENVGSHPSAQQTPGASLPHSQSAVFTDDACLEAFLNLFCSKDVSFEHLGEGAYRSFQFFLKKLCKMADPKVEPFALDALWRICLGVESDTVASQAMTDLLKLYIDKVAKDLFDPDSDAKSPGAHNRQTSPVDAAFGKTVFDCLASVRKQLSGDSPGSRLAAKRCLRILNIAIGQHESAWGSITQLTLPRLKRVVSSDAGVPEIRDVVNYLPHGMRGEESYRKVAIMAKRATTQVQLPQAQHPPASTEDTGASQPRSPTTLRFSLDVHPLETLSSIKSKVASHCECSFQAVKPISVNGRQQSSNMNGPAQTPLNAVSDEVVVNELGIVSGCELVFLITTGHNANDAGTKDRTGGTVLQSLSDIFYENNGGFPNQVFTILLEILEALSTDSSKEPTDDTHSLVWDVLSAMPTNPRIASQILSMAGVGGPDKSGNDDAMDVDTGHTEKWSPMFSLETFHRSVYTLQAVDAMMQPAPEVLSFLPPEHKEILEREMLKEAATFRQGFISSGGFDAVVKYFSALARCDKSVGQNMARMGNAAVLRILKCCLFGKARASGDTKRHPSALDEDGRQLLESLSDSEGLLESLTAMVVRDDGISTSIISDVLKVLQLLLGSSDTAQKFVSLPSRLAEEFLVAVLLWDGGTDTNRPSSIGAASRVRKTVHDLILEIPALADQKKWLVSAIDKIDVTSECTAEYFAVLQKLVSDEGSTAQSRTTSFEELSALGTAVCKKISSCPRPTGDTPSIDLSTGVLCGCLALLTALIKHGGGPVLKEGTDILVADLGLDAARWSSGRPPSYPEDGVVIDLMGVIFDAFLSPGGSSSVVAICCDKESRERGFEVVDAAAQTCRATDGYSILISKINGLVSSAAPFLKHRWGQVGRNEAQSRAGARNTSKYSGLKNQGCTCYMNSFLQQLFMMPELRTSLCSAPLPAAVRSSGVTTSAKGKELVGKKISLQWENGVSYDADVIGFDEATGMHTIRYCPLQVATVSGTSQHQLDDVSLLPPLLPEEFILAEGRPGKETGLFEVVSSGGESPEDTVGKPVPQADQKVEESEDEAASRHLMEEIQRTLIHLDEGSRGHCFDPRALVEACSCLKLEFDVWQQNDASEFATKLLDRLEISLKRWAPDHFRYMDHTFGLKQTKQKICKECGLKTNREEKLLNVDCQIRGKSDIHEALNTMTEVETMEGNNQVFCDRCKKNTDTILRTAISELPNMLILSLKRFDLDYTTFETVKLNSRCAFGQSLNMKKYTLEGLEAVEKAAETQSSNDPAPMDTDSVSDNALRHLPDDDYEYKLAGVLVHAGVAQGGHYYSFIKDRIAGSNGDWFRFDDDDVTPFDPSLIEAECFGGKVKKETKWPNGQVHTVESEQYANALMLFYEKVKPTPTPPPESDDDKEEKSAQKDIVMSSGYDVFEPDVKRSNATHRWQTFLFDDEFHSFLLGLLKRCCPTGDELSKPAEIVAPQPIPPLVNMLSTFFFDVLLYASDKQGLDDWVRCLEQITRSNSGIAKHLVFQLARKTKTVSQNWLRTYLSDCPDQSSRSAATKVFSSAVKACLALETEQKELNAWSQAWKDQLAHFTGSKILPLPCSLTESWMSHEQVSNGDNSGVSLIGTIISHLNELLEVSPRNWKFNPELSVFIRDLASVDQYTGGEIIRDAMLSALIPLRLICLVAKERLSPALRAAFPGASVSVDIAETQVRAESSPTSHIMPISTSMNTSDSSYRGGVSPLDHLPLLEAVCCLLGVRGIVASPLLVEVEDDARGRSRTALTKRAEEALTIIFKESCAPDSPGMGEREIDIYLQRCSVDSSSVSPQKIAEIMSKYPVVAADGTLVTNALSLEGFFEYYIDTAQSNESRVRRDLNIFGFRPDLSRRSYDHRVFVSDNREQMRTAFESIALDVAANINTDVPSGGFYYEHALASFQLYLVAYSASEALGEHLAAAACMSGRDSTFLIANTLRTIYYAQSGWAGSESVGAGMMVLRVLVSLPDEDQQERISFIMQCNDRPSSHAEHGLGLMIAAQGVYASRGNAQHYHAEDLFDRYVQILKYLARIGSVSRWMHEHRQLWQWLERELVEQPRQQPQSRDPSNGGFSPDSDMHGMEDSGDETDSRTFEEIEMDTTYERPPPGNIEVTGAGHPAVNGLYTRDGVFETAYKYSKTGEYNGAQCQFSVFQCNVSNNTKHWYISVVPASGKPGTSADVDFYSAPVTETCREYPPVSGWSKAGEGREPAPELFFTDGRVVVDDQHLGGEESGSYI